ncbi:aminotransferase class IV [Rufibacter sp. LB8]|uniref:aminotransferase class IV n=1 Tax=Rufibacter sp. LB8 TaxID=2777781 RepID=UPI00178C644D|nr:aminotransferase class IV [Rufibacter sp. LB8]
MEYVLWNGQLTAEADFQLLFSNRAFQYGDGFFETLYFKTGQLLFWEEHMERMQEACKVLKLTFPEELKSAVFLQQITSMASKNGCTEEARVKLKVWRSGAGLYTPQTDEVDWFVSLQPLPPLSNQPIRLEICQTVRTVPSVFSGFKGINAPVYVLASREKAHKNLDDVLLLSPTGFMAELTYSNIFWVSGNTLFTPANSTGCVHGVFRRRLKKWAKENKMAFQEGEYLPEELLTADLVFGGNVLGIREINQLSGQPLPTNLDFVDRLRKELW